MPKFSAHNGPLSTQAAETLRAPGGKLALANGRRKNSLPAGAKPIAASARTVHRPGAGKAGVDIGDHAAVQWPVGRIDASPKKADPALDRGTAKFVVRQGRARQSRRAKAAT